MSRPRAPIDRTKESQSVLQGLKKEPPGWKRERLLAVKLGLEGEASLDQIASAVGRARSTIQIWLDRYREGGLGRLMEVSRGKGPASELSEKASRDLQDGLAAGRWRTARQVREFLAKEHALKASLSAVYKYLGKAGARLRVARPVHCKKDPAAAEAFKVTLAEKLAALELEPRRPVRLWVMDESSGAR